MFTFNFISNRQRESPRAEKFPRYEASENGSRFDGSTFQEHFPKIHRSVLRKIAKIYCIFETFMTSSMRKTSVEVRLILAEQMSL